MTDLPDPTPLTVRWDREVIWDDQRGDTIVCCLTDDGQPVALFLNDELREALGAALLDPPWDEEDSMDGFEDGGLEEVDGESDLSTDDAGITYGPNGIRCGCGKDAHSNLTPCDGPDTLPQWLAQRFGKTAWGELDDDTRLWWEHEAAAVRRAVARDGFKAAPPVPAPAVCRCGADPVHQMGCDAE